MGRLPDFSKTSGQTTYNLQSERGPLARTVLVNQRYLTPLFLPDQTSYSAAIVLDEAIQMFPFTIECLYSDNGKKFKGVFKDLCTYYQIPQQFTRPYRPQTNGKAERVIKTIKGLLRKHHFVSREERRRILYAIVRHYNHLRPHQSLGNLSPFVYLENYIQRTKAELKELRSVTNAC